MNAASTIWEEELGEILGIDSEIVAQTPRWNSGLYERDSSALGSVGKIISDVRAHFTSEGIEEWNTQTDISNPQLGQKLGVLRCNKYLLTQPCGFLDWSTEELRWHNFALWEGYFVEYLQKLVEAWRLSTAYQKRINELITYGMEDGVSINKASEEDFWDFFALTNFTRQAGLVLMNNGNLRAVWKNDHSEHIGVQFLGGQRGEFVVFKRRPASADVSRIAGIDTLGGIRNQINSLALASLVKDSISDPA